MRERLKKTMPSKAHHEILTAVGSICTQNLLLPIALVITVVGAVVTALVPPLILENIVDGLTAGNPMPIAQAFSYFGVTALAGLLESTRESLLIVFGQKLTHDLLRSAPFLRPGRLRLAMPPLPPERHRCWRLLPFSAQCWARIRSRRLR